MTNSKEVIEFRKKQEAARQAAIRPGLLRRLREYVVDPRITEEKRAKYAERLKQLEGDS